MSELDELGALYVKRGDRIAVLEEMLRQLIEHAIELDQHLFEEFATGAEGWQEDQVIGAARRILEGDKSVTMPE